MARRRLSTSRDVGTVCFLSLLIIWLGVLVTGIFHKEQVARLTVNDTRAELAALDARAATLAGTVHDLETTRGQEASVRQTYGVAKPGEEVIIVVPKKEAPPPPPKGLWETVKGFLGL